MSHLSKKRTGVEENVSEDGNIETIKTKSWPRGIIIKLAVGIKKFWTENSKNNSLFEGYKD